MIYFQILGLEAVTMKPMTRSERAEQHFSNPELHEHLYARGENDDEAPPPEIINPEMDFFQVSKKDCTSNYAQAIDGWELFDPKKMDCGEDKNKVNLTY